MYFGACAGSTVSLNSCGVVHLSNWLEPSISWLELVLVFGDLQISLRRWRDVKSIYKTNKTYLVSISISVLLCSIGERCILLTRCTLNCCCGGSSSTANSSGGGGDGGSGRRLFPGLTGAGRRRHCDYGAGGRRHDGRGLCSGSDPRTADRGVCTIDLLQVVTKVQRYSTDHFIKVLLQLLVKEKEENKIKYILMSFFPSKLYMLNLVGFWNEKKKFKHQWS